jgi:hypothetical protein
MESKMTFNHNEYIAKQNAEAIARNKPIKAFANFSGYSDVEPFEVVDVRTENKVVIRAMKAERAEGWKPEIVSGGFAGHCTNNEDQRNAWSISPDEEGRLVTLRWSKAKMRWQSACGSRYYMSDTPAKKYDFNF